MKKFNPVYLPYMGAIAQAFLFGVAGNKYFGAFGWLAGGGIGLVINLSMAVASSRISDIAKSRKTLAYLSLIGLFALSPVIITSTMGWSVATLSWSMACDLSILLTGSTFGNSLIAKEIKPQVASKPVGKKNKKEQVAPQVTETLPQEPVKVEQVARKPVSDDALLAYLASNPGESHQQVADHFGVSRQAIGQRVKKLYEVKQ